MGVPSPASVAPCIPNSLWNTMASMSIRRNDRDSATAGINKTAARTTSQKAHGRGRQSLRPISANPAMMQSRKAMPGLSGASQGRAATMAASTKADTSRVIAAICRKRESAFDFRVVMSHSRPALRESKNTGSCALVNENPAHPPIDFPAPPCETAGKAILGARHDQN